MCDTSELDKIFFASLSFHELFKRTARKTLVGITKTQMDIAALCGRKGPLNMSAIGSHLGIQVEQVTRAVKGLAELDIVSCNRDGENRRSVTVRITDHGKEFLAGNRAESNALIKAQLAELSPSELSELASLSQRADALLRKASRDTLPQKAPYNTPDKR